MSNNHRRQYKTYLSNPSISVPRRTLYRVKKGNYRYAKSEFDIEGPGVVNMDMDNQVAASGADDVIMDVTTDHSDTEDSDINLQADDEMNLQDEVLLDIDNLNDWELDDPQVSDEIPLAEWESVEQQKICEGSSLSFHDFAVLFMSAKTAFNMSGISMAFMLKMFKLSMPEKNIVPSLDKLYKYFETKDISMKKHEFCCFCYHFIGERTTNSSKVCEQCGSEDVQYFIEIPLEKELQKVVKRNYSSLTSYRFQREHTHGHISDVYDGEQYQKHFGEKGFLRNRHNISLIGNTDGVAIFKSSAFSVWPIYMVINELPPSLRFRRQNRLLCGLWFGRSKPNFTTYFKPFAETAWKLYTEGFQVSIEEGECQKEEAWHAVLLQMTCDSPAKCMFQDFMQFNAFYGCPYCLHEGESHTYPTGGRSHVYPYRTEEENGFGLERTHKQTIEYATISRQNLNAGKRKYAEKGVKGLSWALSLPGFDIINGMCLDYMHGVLLGVMKQLLTLWTKDKNQPWSINGSLRKVKDRLMKINPPNNITRAPRSLDELNHWKASELRNFLLFFGPSCLYNILPETYYDHFLLLSQAVWLFLQEDISPKQIEVGNRHLQYFVFQMSTLYGKQSMTFSVHLLLHLIKTVEQNGPLWCQSCFFFEDYNGELRQFFHSSQHPDSQVARAATIVQILPEMVERMENREAIALVKAMTSDRYKAKTLKETEKAVFLVGVPQVTTLTWFKDAKYLEAVLLVYPFHNGQVALYKRALIHGQMVHSQQYQKVSQRNSYTVQYTASEGVAYGSVQSFAEICDNGSTYYHAFITPFHEKKEKLVNDTTTGLKLHSLKTFYNERTTDMQLVPLNCINAKVILMETGDQGFFSIGIFPNTIEKD